jgi:hypothetical protein
MGLMELALTKTGGIGIPACPVTVGDSRDGYPTGRGASSSNGKIDIPACAVLSW